MSTWIGGKAGPVSRRGFLLTSAVTSTGATLVQASTAILGAGSAMAGETNQIGPGATPVTLRVNGSVRTLQIEPRMTLAEVLRGPLGLTGTKISCNRGACAACTVWLDKAPICSCMMLAVEVGDRNITTIEGLARGEELHPVQAAFIDHDAVQCGFCTSGMVMGCASLVERNPNPTADDVKTAISGHICRCGTYPHVVAATLAAAKTGRP